MTTESTWDPWPFILSLSTWEPTILGNPATFEAAHKAFTLQLGARNHGDGHLTNVSKKWMISARR